MGSDPTVGQMKPHDGRNRDDVFQTNDLYTTQIMEFYIKDLFSICEHLVYVNKSTVSSDYVKFVSQETSFNHTNKMERGGITIKLFAY